MNRRLPSRWFTILWPVLVLVASGFWLPGQADREFRPNSSGGPLRADQACFDVRHYDLRLNVDIERQSIQGVLTMEARIVSPSSQIALDLDDRLQVSLVRLAGQGNEEPVAFQHSQGVIRIDLPASYSPGEALKVTVYYGGKPREAPNPPWGGGFIWKKDSRGNPWIAVACQLEGADLWWPCKDHPSDEPDSMDLHITVPRPLVVASNGILAGKEEDPEGNLTYHWKILNPINNYNVTLNIANYLQISQTYTSTTGQKVPVTFWVLPENQAKALELISQFAEHLKFLEEELGPYPFRNEKYGVVETPYLGMEHQTIISYGNQYRNNRFGFDTLHFHELAHEWWGNQLSVTDWKDYWIHEGFASYMEALYAESLGGTEALVSHMASVRKRLRNQEAVVPRESRTTVEKYFVPPEYNRSDGDINSKGAWVLHTLRYLVGDEVFHKSLRRFTYPQAELEGVTDGRQCRFVTTDDFIQVVEEISGRNLRWFFDVYLRQPRLPVLEATESDGQLLLRWQTPDAMPFPMPVPIRVGSQVRRLEVSSIPVTLELPEGINWEIDPDGWVLRE